MLNEILEKCQEYSVKHILVAFEKGGSAAMNKLNDIQAIPGDLVFADCGLAVCVVNEKKHPFYTITDLTWSYEYSNTFQPSSSFCHGRFVVTDTAGTSFADFLSKNVSDTTATSVGNMTFNLSSTIYGTDTSGGQFQVDLKPLIFKITDITESSSISGRIYVVYFTMDYNTTAQIPNVSKFTRLTVSNSNGDPENLSDFLGSSQASQPYAARQAANKPARDSRNDNVPPIINLKEMTDSINKAFNDCVKKPKQILQSLLNGINESHSPKIEAGDKDEDLPIEYEVQLDEKYQSYLIDNRNLINEQCVIDQEAPGIRSITFPIGFTLNQAYETAFKLSKQIGQDVLDGYIYRLNTVSRRTCADKLKQTTRIKRIEIPLNEVNGKDTGNGAEGNINPITYTFQQDNLIDVTVFGLDRTGLAAESYEFAEKTAESPESGIHLGDRESALFIRKFENRDFFKAKFSGLRINTNSHNISVESPDLASAVDYTKFKGKRQQTNTVSVYLRGNPDLYNDLARSPIAVEGQNPDGAVHYQFPELLPMYAKLNVNIKADADRGGGQMVVDQRNFYYDKFYHIISVQNFLSANSFTQKIILARTDDIL